LVRWTTWSVPQELPNLIVVTADERSLGGVLLGRVGFADAVTRGEIRFEGPAALVRAFPTWLGLTRFAKYAHHGQETEGIAMISAGSR
jgi:hypothetical protein